LAQFFTNSYIVEKKRKISLNLRLVLKPLCLLGENECKNKYLLSKSELYVNRQVKLDLLNMLIMTLLDASTSVIEELGLGL
jgi:hypothetical protein